MRTIAPPVPAIEATGIMLDLLDLKKTDKLLEIGTGTGSQTQTWEQYAGEVHSIELRRDYKCSDALGPHVYLSYGDGAKGDPGGAPFDAIVCTCGISEVPSAWLEQLVTGGRLVAPLGTPECQKLTLFQKVNEELKPLRTAAYVRFVMMEKP